MAAPTATLSLQQLSGAVGVAVKAALDRHKVKATSGFIINPGTLAGPLLDRATDLKVAQQLAEDITKQVQQANLGAQSAPAEAAEQPSAALRLSLQPAVLITNRYILCGFFPFDVPQLRIDTI